MFICELNTRNPAVRLIKPDVERDAPLGVAWLTGAQGRETLRLMGVAPEHIMAPDIEVERERVQGFLDGKDELEWMIAVDDKPVGAIWVWLRQNGTLPAPSVHLMIGDPNARGKGVGSASLQAVLAYLKQDGHQRVYSRCLTSNTASAQLLAKFGFKKLDEPYHDEDGLEFQNVVLEQ